MSQKTSSCVREAVENIEDLQNAVEEDCPTGCHSKLLSVSHSLGDTVPFAIFTSKSTPLVASEMSANSITALALIQYFSGSKECMELCNTVIINRI